jgi:hypothetical protein
MAHDSWPTPTRTNALGVIPLQGRGSLYLQRVHLTVLGAQRSPRRFEPFARQQLLTQVPARREIG